MTSPDAAISRRRFLRTAAGAAAAAGLLPACSHGGAGRARRRVAGPGPAPIPVGQGAGKPLRIGCIAPFTGPYAGVGQVVTAALAAASGHIDSELGGTYQGYTAQVFLADAPLTADQGQKAFAQVRSQQVDAILWCGSPGLNESLPDIVRGLVPVIAVGTDLHSRSLVDGRVPNLATIAGAGFPVFQTSVPDTFGIDLLLEYAAQDRAFTRAALAFSASSSPGADAIFDASCQRHGVDNAGATAFDTRGGPPDLHNTVAALAATGAQTVVLVANAAESAALATLLDGRGSRYVDTPTAKGAVFAPMLLGVEAATSTQLFARAAGVHGAKGTIGASALGSAVGLPDVPMRAWIKRYVPSYNGGLPQGGENGPADALAALLGAAATARSTVGADVVAALESGVQTQFASTVPLRFAPDRHLSVTAGDLCLVTLEYAPEARYNLGRDWPALFPAGSRATDLLVDFTLDRNRKQHPDILGKVVDLRYGISSQSAYQDGDPGKISACRAVH